jgi:hypothetical protein
MNFVTLLILLDILQRERFLLDLLFFSQLICLVPLEKLFVFIELAQHGCRGIV